MKNQTNPKYPNFFQEIYHAGDRKQFYEKLTDDSKNDLKVQQTFNYLFDNFKKGIFVEIIDGDLITYLPFSNVNYKNNWSKNLTVNPRHGNIDVVKFQELNFRDFSKDKKYQTMINKKAEKWYANNGMFRNTIYKNGILRFLDDEGDKSVKNFLDLILYSLKNNSKITTKFFISPRDFPILRKDMKHPYDLLYPIDETPTLKYDSKSLLPIFSQSKSEEFADKLIPNDDDIVFLLSTEIIDYHINWELKKNMAVFRGSATGFGVNSDSNIRLKLIEIAKNSEIIDAELTGLNIKPKVDPVTRYVDIIDKSKYKKGKFLLPEEQAKYKFVIHLQGHVAAFRLTKELSYGSVILKVDSPWKTWYSDLLKPGIHYIPIKEDLSDLEDKIDWCLKNDKYCENIANNAYSFWLEHFQTPDFMVDYFISELE